METRYCLKDGCGGLVIGQQCNQCGSIVSHKRVLRICGLDIEVKEVNLSSGHFGQASLERSEILINKDLKQDLKDDTLLHEVIHTISMVNALDVTEEQTACLANNLMQYLKDN